MSPTFTLTCDWGNCDKPTFGWRLDGYLVQWLCVCDEHFKDDDKVLAVTLGEVEDLYKAQQEFR